MIEKRAGEFRASDVFVASYPRSGNTWMRLLLSDIVLQNSGLSSSTELPVHQDKVIPNVDDFQSFDTDSRVSLNARLLKTHAEFHPMMKRVVYVFRRPDDCLCSYFHYHLRYDDMQSYAAKGVDDFCRRKVKPWSRHVSGFLRATETESCEIFFTSYEQLHTNTIRVLQELTDWLGIPCTLEQCRQAIGNHAFKKHRALAHPKGKFNERFYRKGVVGSAQSEIAETTFRKLQSKPMRLYERACQILTVKTEYAETPRAA